MVLGTSELIQGRPFAFGQLKEYFPIANILSFIVAKFSSRCPAFRFPQDGRHDTGISERHVAVVAVKGTLLSSVPPILLTGCSFLWQILKT